LRPEVSRFERRLVLSRRRTLGTRDGARPVGSPALVLCGRLPRADVGPGWMVEQPVEELGRRLALARRAAVDAAPVERGLEGTPRAFGLRLPRQDLGCGWPCATAEQRGLVARDSGGMVHGLSLQR